MPLKRRMTEFRVTPDALLPVGTLLNAAHYTPGQFVDVQGELTGSGLNHRLPETPHSMPITPAEFHHKNLECRGPLSFAGLCKPIHAYVRACTSTLSREGTSGG